MDSEIEQKFADLIARTRAGNEAAYQMLLRECLPMIRQNARGYLSRFGQHSFAEDAVQETLLAIHQKLHTYDAGQPFLPWLHSVARHKAIDFLRRNRIKTTSIDDEDAMELPDEHSAQDTTAHRDLDKLLARLKPPAGDIIFALKVEGSSVAELARKFNMSESNIKVTVHRGLARLSALVRAEGAVMS